MDDLNKLTEFFENSNAKTMAEIHVLKHLVTVLMSRHAREYDDPENYIMTMTAPILSAFDEMKADGSMSEIGFEHAAGFCNEVETHALSLLAVEGGEGN